MNLLLKFQLKTGTTSSWEPAQYKTRNYSLGASSTDILLKGANTSSIPTVGEGLAYLVSGVSGFRLAKKALSGCTKRKLKKARTRARKLWCTIKVPGCIHTNLLLKSQPKIGMNQWFKTCLRQMSGRATTKQPHISCINVRL
jgi:hypothetical protein